MALSLPGRTLLSCTHRRAWCSTPSRASRGSLAPIHLIAPNVIASVGGLKTDLLEPRSRSAWTSRRCLSLSICAATNPTAQYAMEKLKDLGGCEVHMTHMPTPGRSGAEAPGGQPHERAELRDEEPV